MIYVIVNADSSIFTVSEKDAYQVGVGQTKYVVNMDIKDLPEDFDLGLYTYDVGTNRFVKKSLLVVEQILNDRGIKRIKQDKLDIAKELAAIEVLKKKGLWGKNSAEEQHEQDLLTKLDTYK